MAQKRRRNTIVIFGWLGPTSWFMSQPTAQVLVGPAATGEAIMVAQKVIHDNFEKAVCPLVVKADRFGDGSIRARCNNNKMFRVFSVRGVGNVTMKCSAAVKLGVSGC